MRGAVDLYVDVELLSQSYWDSTELGVEGGGMEEGKEREEGRAREVKGGR